MTLILTVQDYITVKLEWTGLFDVFDFDASNTRLFGTDPLRQGDTPARHDFLTAAITHTNYCKYFVQCGYRVGELSAYTDQGSHSCQVLDLSRQWQHMCRSFLGTKTFKAILLALMFVS